MSKFGRDKIALALACALIFGDNAQASQDVKNEQSLGEVEGVAVHNSGQTKKSKNMSGLTKGLIATFSTLVGIEIANELLGSFTKADTFYKGKFSIAKAIKNSKNKVDEVIEKNEKVDEEIEKTAEYLSQKYKEAFEIKEVNRKTTELELLRLIFKKNMFALLIHEKEILDAISDEQIDDRNKIKQFINCLKERKFEFNSKSLSKIGIKFGDNYVDVNNYFNDNTAVSYFMFTNLLYFMCKSDLLRIYKKHNNIEYCLDKI